MRSFTGGVAVAVMCALLLGSARQAPGARAQESAGGAGESAGITTTVNCQGMQCTTSVSASGDECLSLNSRPVQDGETPIALALPQTALFQQALSDVGIADRLDNIATNAGFNYTVFLPTNEAILSYFEISNLAAPSDTFFNDNKQITKELLAYTIVNGVYYSNELQDGEVLETRLLNDDDINSNLTVADNGFGFTIEGDESQADVVLADIPICHGVAHLINYVLVFKELARQIDDENGNK